MIKTPGPEDRAYRFGSVWSRSMVVRVAVLALSLGFSQGAIAFSAACNDNIKKLCADVLPGAYRLTSCLIENQSQLSLECRSEVFVSIERGADFNKSCKQDITTLCPKITTGHGRVYSCLVLQEKLLSANCRSRLDTVSRPKLGAAQ